MINIQQVEDWLGSDIERESLLYMLKEIANGEYTSTQLHNDIESYKIDG